MATLTANTVLRKLAVAEDIPPEFEEVTTEVCTEDENEFIVPDPEDDEGGGDGCLVNVTIFTFWTNRFGVVFDNIPPDIREEVWPCFIFGGAFDGESRVVYRFKEIRDRHNWDDWDDEDPIIPPSP